MHVCTFVWCLHRYICAVCACIGAGVCIVYVHAHACVHAHLHMPAHVKAGDECWFSFSTAFHLFGSVFLNVSLKLKLTSFARLACQRAHRIGLSQPFCAGVINTQHQEITEALALDKNRRFMSISLLKIYVVIVEDIIVSFIIYQLFYIKYYSLFK